MISNRVTTMMPCVVASFRVARFLDMSCRKCTAVFCFFLPQILSDEQFTIVVSAAACRVELTITPTGYNITTLKLTLKLAAV